MTPGSGVTITGCSFVGTEPTFGAYYDVTREYNLMISIWSGANDVTISNNTFRGVWGTYVVGSSGGSNATITNNTFQNCGYYGVQLNQTGGANPGTYVSNNTFIDCSYGSEDSSGVKGSPNEYQYIQYNTVYPTAQRGVGYNRSQTSLGLWSAGSVWLDCGTSASGGTPNSQEYLGVTCSNNHVYGANSMLTPCPSGGCSYTKSYGETMLNNICDNGCNGTAISNTSSPPAITSSTSASGTVGATFSYQITATNSPTSFGASGLPAGLVLSATTGLISGTPANAGVSNITISASNSAGTGQATVVLTIGAGASSSIALKQSNAVQGSAVGSVSVAFPSANSGGNLIVAFVRMSTTTQAVSVTDSAGNTYADAVAQAQTTDGHQVHIFYAKNIHGGANTVKATFSATNNHPWLAIYEYSGLNSISPLDRVAAAQGGSTNVSTGLSGTIQNSNEVVFVGAGFNTPSFTGTVSAGGGYSMLQQNTNTSRAANESAIVSSTGSYAGTFSLSTTANWSAVLATFRP